MVSSFIKKNSYFLKWIVFRYSFPYETKIEYNCLVYKIVFTTTNQQKKGSFQTFQTLIHKSFRVVIFHRWFLFLSKINKTVRGDVGYRILVNDNNDIVHSHRTKAKDAKVFVGMIA